MEIGFIDFSQGERNRILSALRLLGDQTALDELGIGSVRDAYADLLFPGISTQQTRAKYFVLLPYLFAKGEQLVQRGKLHDGKEFLSWLNREEDKLVPVLVGHSRPGDTGIIGSNALKQKRAVKMKPSELYWSGLRALGIVRRDKLSLPMACTLMVQRAKQQVLERKTEGETYDDQTASDTGETLFLPIHSEEPMEAVGISLTKREAEFLAECIARSPHTRGSLLDFLVRKELVCADFEEIPENGMEEGLRRDYRLAKEFRRFIYGAHLRYNVIYSNGTDQAMEARFFEWHDAFFQRPFSLAPVLNRVSCPASLMQFCCRFLELAEKKEWGELDELVVARERQVKGDRAKLHKPHEYRYNQERPIHDYLLDFRFGRANVIIQDILNGLGG